MQNNDNRNNNKDKQPPVKRRNPFIDLAFIVVFILCIVGIILFITNLVRRDPTTLDYKTFDAYCTNGNIVQPITATPLGGDNTGLYVIEGQYLLNNETNAFRVNVTTEQLNAIINTHGSTVKLTIVGISENVWLQLLISLIPYIIIGLLLFFMFRSILKSQGGAGGAFDFGK